MESLYSLRTVSFLSPTKPTPATLLLERTMRLILRKSAQQFTLNFLTLGVNKMAVSKQDLKSVLKKHEDRETPEQEAAESEHEQKIEREAGVEKRALSSEAVRRLALAGAEGVVTVAGGIGGYHLYKKHSKHSREKKAFWVGFEKQANPALLARAAGFLSKAKPLLSGVGRAAAGGAVTGGAIGAFQAPGEGQSRLGNMVRGAAGGAAGSALLHAGGNAFRMRGAGTTSGVVQSQQRALPTMRNVTPVSMQKMGSFWSGFGEKVASGKEIQELLSNPEIADLMNNPEVKALANKAKGFAQMLGLGDFGGLLGGAAKAAPVQAAKATPLFKNKHFLGGMGLGATLGVAGGLGGYHLHQKNKDKKFMESVREENRAKRSAQQETNPVMGY